MNKYTLEELAHFNRCMFPESFVVALMKQGIDPGQAQLLGMWVARHPKAGIVGFYQEFTELKPCLEIILNEFHFK